MDQRSLNPWFDNAQGQFSSHAREFRDLAVPEEATQLGIAHALEDLASRIDDVAEHNRALGAQDWAQYLGKVATAISEASAVKAKSIDNSQLNDESRKTTVQMIRDSARALAHLATQASRELTTQGFGRWEELRDKAAEQGSRLQQISHYNLAPEIPKPVNESLGAIGKQLNLLETYEQRTNGRDAIDKCLNAIVRSSQELARLVPPPANATR